MEIKARDLLAAGWLEGPRLGSALRRARELDDTGLDRALIFARLEQEFPKQEFPKPAARPKESRKACGLNKRANKPCANQ